MRQRGLSAAARGRLQAARRRRARRRAHLRQLPGLLRAPGQRAGPPRRRGRGRVLRARETVFRAVEGEAARPRQGAGEARRPAAVAVLEAARGEAAAEGARGLVGKAARGAAARARPQGVRGPAGRQDFGRAARREAPRRPGGGPGLPPREHAAAGAGRVRDGDRRRAQRARLQPHRGQGAGRRLPESPGVRRRRGQVLRERAGLEGARRVPAPGRAGGVVLAEAHRGRDRRGGRSTGTFAAHLPRRGAGGGAQVRAQAQDQEARAAARAAERAGAVGGARRGRRRGAARAAVAEPAAREEEAHARRRRAEPRGGAGALGGPGRPPLRPRPEARVGEARRLLRQGRRLAPARRRGLPADPPRVPGQDRPAHGPGPGAPPAERRALRDVPGRRRRSRPRLRQRDRVQRRAAKG